MSRKSKQSKHKKKFTASLSPVDKYLDLMGIKSFKETTLRQLLTANAC